MWTWLAIAETGLVSVFLHPLRSLATVFSLIAALLPFVCGLAISDGLQWEATASIEQGSDLYLIGRQFGHKVPLPDTLVPQIESLPGVTRVTPRIVAPVYLGKDQVPAFVVGLPAHRFPARMTIVDGRLPAAGSLSELVVGTTLARELKLDVGSVIPPFYKSTEGDRVSHVVGVFRGEGSLWQSHMMLTTFDNAALIFDHRGYASELLIDCQPGYTDQVRQSILTNIGPEGNEGRSALRLEAMTREAARAVLPRGLVLQEGIFALHFLLLLAGSVLVLMITSGIGSPERRREFGILKAMGWQTDEILLRSLAEGLVLSLTGAVLSLLLAYAWLRIFNGFWIAGVFLAGAGMTPSFLVPFRFLPTPVVLTVILSLAIVLTGSLHSTWRAAIVPPRVAMR